MGDEASTDWVRRAYECADVMAATVVPPDFTFVACNAAYRDFYRKGDLVGRTPLDIWPELVGSPGTELEFAL